MLIMSVESFLDRPFPLPVGPSEGWVAFSEFWSIISRMALRTFTESLYETISDCRVGVWGEVDIFHLLLLGYRGGRGGYATPSRPCVSVHGFATGVKPPCQGGIDSYPRWIRMRTPMANVNVWVPSSFSRMKLSAPVRSVSFRFIFRSNSNSL